MMSAHKRRSHLRICGQYKTETGGLEWGFIRRQALLRDLRSFHLAIAETDRAPDASDRTGMAISITDVREADEDFAVVLTK